MKNLLKGIDKSRVCGTIDKLFIGGAMDLDGFVFDIEVDNLYLFCKKVWYIRFTSLDKSKSLSVFPFREDLSECKKKIEDFVNSFSDGCFVVGHNILGFDLWVLWKILGIKPVVGKKGDFFCGKPVKFVDTFVLSQLINPDSPKHSLEYLSGGEENGGKIDYRQRLISLGVMDGTEPKGHEFSFFHKEIVPYCDRDVESNIGVFFDLYKKGEKLYTEFKQEWPHKALFQMQKDYWLYSAQAFSGVKFNEKGAKDLVEKIEKMMEDIKQEVDPLLPPRPLKSVEVSFYRMPAKPYKMDGSLSSTMEKWLEKHKATLLEDGYVEAYGKVYKILAGQVLDVKLPMEIDDNIELKQYFLENGWEPSEDYWNFKKDENGKNERDSKGKLIKTSPKINHAGKICPNLLELQGEVPSKVVKFLSLRNRLGVVNGWLNHPRLSFDGRLPAEISGYAPTSRVKHRTVVNVPKAAPDVLLGCEMRDLFTVEDGNYYIGTDAAALENRTLSHYTFKFDNGEFARRQTESDPHSFNAFAFFPEISNRFNIEDQENKEKPEFKPFRNKAKTGAYLLAFGGGAPKLASSLGLSQAEGKLAYENYWKMNVGLGLLKEKVERYFETTGRNKHILAMDGRVVFVRGKNVLLSCLGQGLGAICMSYAACFMDAWLGEMFLDSLGRPYYLYKGCKVQRISMIHDEFSWEVEGGIEDEILALTEKSIVKAGEFLKLTLPLDSEGKKSYNGTWKDVH